MYIDCQWKMVRKKGQTVIQVNIIGVEIENTEIYIAILKVESFGKVTYISLWIN